MSKRNGSTAAATPPVEEAAQIAIDSVPIKTISVPIVGTSPLIMHAWSEKAKRQMLDAQQGKKTPKVARDPAADFEAAFYRLEDGAPGFPVVAFKAATVGAARFYGKDVSMTALRQFLFFKGEIGADGRQMCRIEGEAIMREDTVRLGKSGSDLRYRPEFREWSTTLLVTYATSALTEGSVLGLIDAGGLGVGVGEWRPERGGDFGQYAVDTNRDVEVVG